MTRLLGRFLAYLIFVVGFLVFTAVMFVLIPAALLFMLIVLPVLWLLLWAKNILS